MRGKGDLFAPSSRHARHRSNGPNRFTHQIERIQPMTQHVPQRTLTDLKTMSPEAIVAADAAGELAELLGSPAPIDIQATAGESAPRPPRENPAQGGAAMHAVLPLAQLDQEDLRAMSAEAILAAQAAGQLDNLMGRPPRPSIDPRP
jgi:hypothetical protein